MLADYSNHFLFQLLQKKDVELRYDFLQEYIHSSKNLHVVFISFQP
jgi:hypothetical protein